MDLTANQELRVNHVVAIRCETTPSENGDTYAVSIDTGGSPLVGTVSATTMGPIGENGAHVRAVIVKVRRRTVTVWVPGSFENSNGRVSIDRAWLEQNAIVQAAPESPIAKRRLPFYWGHGWFHDLGVATDRRRRNWRNQSGMRGSDQR